MARAGSAHGSDGCLASLDGYSVSVGSLLCRYLLTPCSMPCLPFVMLSGFSGITPIHGLSLLPSSSRHCLRSLRGVRGVNWTDSLTHQHEHSHVHQPHQGRTKRMQATARRLSVVSATSTARRRLIRDVRPTNNTRHEPTSPTPADVRSWTDSRSFFHLDSESGTPRTESVTSSDHKRSLGYRPPLYRRVACRHLY